MDREQYATFEPVPAELLLEKVGEYQGEVDTLQGRIDALKEEAKDASKERDRWQAKIALIGRAREHGRPVYMLLGGELTDEEPDPVADPTLFDSQAPATTPEAPEVEPPQEVTPEDEDAIFTARTEDGRECVVVFQNGGWWGRCDGKPYALGVPSSEQARNLVAEGVAETLDWEEAPEDTGGEV